MSDSSPSAVNSPRTRQQQYLDALRQALDDASRAFFAANSDLSRDGQLELISSWSEHERRSPYRPAMLAAGEMNGVGGGVGGKKKKVRGYIDGCYDVMHSGHFNAIRQAKVFKRKEHKFCTCSLCDELIVGVHSDAEILREKGPPVMNDEERLAAVRSCKWVDQVVFGVPYTPSMTLLDELECDFCVHGDDDATTANGSDAFAEAKAAGRMAIVKRTEGVSTTDLVNRLLALTKETSSMSEDVAASPTAPAASPAAPAVASISSFLPTTWRLSQFANHRVPKPTDKVVYIAGSFDLFHLGHIEKLEEAKKLVRRREGGQREKGAFLYVGVFDDPTVCSYKGRNPVMNLHERVLNVLSCKFVDEVVIGAPFQITPDLLKTFNVAVVARADPSESSRRTSVPDPYAVIQSLVPIQTVQPRSSLHTSDVIQRILDNRTRYEKRNASRAVKDQAYAAKKTYVQEK